MVPMVAIESARFTQCKPSAHIAAPRDSQGGCELSMLPSSGSQLRPSPQTWGSPCAERGEKMR